MQGLRTIFFCASILLTAYIFNGCSPRKAKLPKARQDKAIGVAPSYGRIWVPEYFNYENGKYQFVKGYYRKVISRRSYYKRSLRGYAYQQTRYYTTTR